MSKKIVTVAQAEASLRIAFSAYESAKTCVHASVSSQDKGYSASVARPPHDENRAAAGNICVHETCSCGATRATNVNGRHEETSGWVLDDLLAGIDAAEQNLAIAKRIAVEGKAATDARRVKVVGVCADAAAITIDGQPPKWIGFSEIRDAANQPDNGDGLVPFYRGIELLIAAGA